MWQIRLVKALPYIVLGLLIVAVAMYGHHSIKQSGFREGAASVQEKWDQETENYQGQIEKLKSDIAQKEADHRTDTTRITHELAEANRKHAVEVATLQSDYARRLQLSGERSVIYQRQAEGGAVECRGLASHASRLDAALEEGRALEREYRSTLGLRDQQIKALSDQIKNDRNLLDY